MCGLFVFQFEACPSEALRRIEAGSVALKPIVSFLASIPIERGDPLPSPSQCRPLDPIALELSWTPYRLA
jgi:hypothetical protein